MTIQQILQTPQQEVPEQATHYRSSVATDDTRSEPAPAEVVDYSWYLVAAQGDHAIFGNGDILHGTELKKRATRKGHLLERLFLSPAFRHLCVPADRHGHNNLEVGQWFANLTTAYFHGAHGALQLGIVGIEDGAFSVVITSSAGTADIDNGYRALYVGRKATTDAAASRSPTRPATLVVEISEERPAIVSGSENKTFWHFEMRRLPGQTPLEELRDISPSEEEMNQFQSYRNLLESVVA